MLRPVLVAAFLLGVSPVFAAGVPELRPSAPSRSELDVLFDRLKHAHSDVEADALENRIAEIWSQSSSDTATLLFARGLEAMDADKAPALELLTAVTELQPDFAQGWEELGAINAALDAQDAAVLDLQRALALEPRHYGALLGL